MAESEEGSQWGILALAGVCGLYCVSFAGLAGGAALVGGATAGVGAASGAVRSLGGLLVTGLATALPLLVLGLVLCHRAR